MSKKNEIKLKWKESLLASEHYGLAVHPILSVAVFPIQVMDRYQVSVNMVTLAKTFDNVDEAIRSLE